MRGSWTTESTTSFAFGGGGRILEVATENKNSSGDEIANVNFLRRYGTYVLQNTKKENLLRLTN